MNTYYRRPKPKMSKGNIAAICIAVAIALGAVIFAIVSALGTVSSDGKSQYAGKSFISSENLPDMQVESADDALKLLSVVDGAGTEFYITDTRSTTSGTVYKAQQTYGGDDIYGAQRVVSVDREGEPIFVAGNVSSEVHISDDDLSNLIDLQSLEDLAIQHSGLDNIGMCGSVMYWYFVPCSDNECAYQPVYSIFVPGTDVNGFGTMRQVIINARTGDVYRIIDCNMRMEEVPYEAQFGGESFITTYATDLDAYILKDLEREITVYDAQAPNVIYDGCYAFPGPQFYVTDDNNIWDDDDDPAINEHIVPLYLNMIQAYDFYTGLDESAVYSSIDVFVNSDLKTSWTKGTDQFHFNKNQDYMRCADVAGHELTHYVIGDDLQYYDMPGALHESFADCMGALIEGKTGDGFYSIGEDGVEIIRMLDSRDNNTAAHMDNYRTESYEEYEASMDEDAYYDSGAMHYNCGIPSMAFIKLYESGLFTSEELIKLYYGTMISLHDDAEFWDARQIMLGNCTALFSIDSPQFYAVKEAWDSVGVTHDTRDDHSDYPQSDVAELFEDTETSGKVNYPYDYDCLKFVPDADASYTFALDRTWLNIGNISFYVLNERMDVVGYNEVLSIKDAAEMKYATITCDLQAGHTYYVVMKGMTELAEYTVTATQGGSITLPEPEPEPAQDIVLPQTGGPVEFITQSLQYHDEYTDVYVKYPEIRGMLDAGLEVYLNTELEDLMYSISNEADAAAKEDDPGYPYAVQADYTVCRNDGVFISFYIDTYVEMGGAHGGEYAYHYNILNTNPGQVLKLGDLFNVAFDDLQTYINNYITGSIAADEELSGEGWFETINEDLPFYLTDSRLVLFFQPGDIMPYILGRTEFSIPLSDLSGLLRPELFSNTGTQPPSQNGTLPDGRYLATLWQFDNSTSSFVYDDNWNRTLVGIAESGNEYLVQMHMLEYVTLTYDEFQRLISGEVIDTEAGSLQKNAEYVEGGDDPWVVRIEDGLALQMFCDPSPDKPDIVWIDIEHPLMVSCGIFEFNIHGSTIVYCEGIDDESGFDYATKTFSEYMSSGSGITDHSFSSTISIVIENGEVIEIYDHYES